MDGYAFDNFDLLVEAAGEGFRSRVLDSPAGQASSLFKRPFSTLELENFFLKLGQPRQNVRRIESYEAQAAKQFGGQLFRSVFSGDVYACFLSSLAAAKKAGRGLRIRLRIDSPEFLDLPWELLYNPNQNQFISLSADTPVIRYLETSQSDQALVVQPPLHVLAMISSPEGYPPLDIDQEWRNLATALAPLADTGLVLLERLERPTLTCLQQRLRRGPVHIFHFIGHGRFTENEQEGKLLLEDENGRGRPVSGQFLGTLLHDHHSLRLAVLNACEGARTSPVDAFSGVAHTLIQLGLPAVIAMQFEITDTAAITFSQEFYSALADGYPVDAAISEARKAIFASGNETEWGTPVLYMRTPQGIIFEIPTGTRPSGSHAPPAQTGRVDKDRQTALDRLYTEGLAAFWVEDWDEACRKFETLLKEQPRHAEAKTRLKEARHRSLISQLYEKARERLSAGDHGAAIEALEQLQREAPAYKDSSALLEQAGRKLRLDSLYEEARELHRAGQWQAVVKVFEQIAVLDPSQPDPEGLFPSAQQEVAEIDRMAGLNDLYSRAVREMDAGHWAEARALLDQVSKTQAAFLQTDRLLKKAETEIARAEDEEQRSQRISTLYEQAFGLARSKSWRKALDKMEEIRAMDPAFIDRERIAEKARSALEHDETEAQRQSELAAQYARAVQLLGEEKYQAALDALQEVKAVDPKYPDRQRVLSIARRKLAEVPKPIQIKTPPIKPKTLWIALGGLITVAAVIAAVIFFRPQAQETIPTAQPAPTKPIQVKPSATSAFSQPTITPLPFTPPPPQPPIDPTLYDGFNDDAYGGSFNPSLWAAVGDTSGSVLRQSNGSLSIKVTSDKTAGLDAQIPRFNKPFFLETRLFLDPATTEKEALLFIVLNSEHGFSVCGVFGFGNNKQNISCWSEYYGKHVEHRTGLDGIPTGWHVFRFEVDPESMNIDYFVDGYPVDTYRPAVSIPDHLEEFKRSTFSFSVTLNNLAGASAPVGYVDYVRMGPIADDPSVYSNFDNPAFDGNLDPRRWRNVSGNPSGRIYQDQGRLFLTQTGKNLTQTLKATSLLAAPAYVEADFELDKSTALGMIEISLEGDTNGVSCRLAYFIPGSPSRFCHFDSPEKHLDFGTSIVSLKRTYKFGIEIDRTKRTTRFFMDGREVASYEFLPTEPMDLNEVYIQIWASTDGTLNGYADNIIIKY